MPDYRLNRVPGGTFFFTVNLLDRNPVKHGLVEHAADCLPPLCGEGHYPESWLSGGDSLAEVGEPR
jgi:hypothetical protein